MVTIDQQLWNALFGWMREGQCMLPEGCTVPAEGVLFYLGTIVAIAVVLNWKNQIRENFLDTLEAAQDIVENR